MVSSGLILFEVLIRQAVGCLVTVQVKRLRRWAILVRQVGVFVKVDDDCGGTPVFIE